VVYNILVMYWYYIYGYWVVVVPQAQYYILG